MEYTHKVEVIAEHFKISTLVDLLKSLESKKAGAGGGAVRAVVVSGTKAGCDRLGAAIEQGLTFGASKKAAAWAVTKAHGNMRYDEQVPAIETFLGTKDTECACLVMTESMAKRFAVVESGAGSFAGGSAAGDPANAKVTLVVNFDIAEDLFGRNVAGFRTFIQRTGEWGAVTFLTGMLAHEAKAAHSLIKALKAEFPSEPIPAALAALDQGAATISARKMRTGAVDVGPEPLPARQPDPEVELVQGSGSGSSDGAGAGAAAASAGTKLVFAYVMTGPVYDRGMGPSRHSSWVLPDHSFLSRRDALARCLVAALWSRPGGAGSTQAAVYANREVWLLYEQFPVTIIRLTSDFARCIRSKTAPTERVLLEIIDGAIRGRQEVQGLTVHRGFESVAAAAESFFGMLPGRPDEHMLLELHESRDAALPVYSEEVVASAAAAAAAAAGGPASALRTVVTVIGCVDDHVEPVATVGTAAAAMGMPIHRVNVGPVAEFTSKVVHLIQAHHDAGVLVPALSSLGPSEGAVASGAIDMNGDADEGSGTTGAGAPASLPAPPTVDADGEIDKRAETAAPSTIPTHAAADMHFWCWIPTTSKIAIPSTEEATGTNPVLGQGSRPAAWLMPNATMVAIGRSHGAYARKEGVSESTISFVLNDCVVSVGSAAMQRCMGERSWGALTEHHGLVILRDAIDTDPTECHFTTFEEALTTVTKQKRKNHYGVVLDNGLSEELDLYGPAGEVVARPASYNDTAAMKTLHFFLNPPPTARGVFKKVLAGNRFAKKSLPGMQDSLNLVRTIVSLQGHNNCGRLFGVVSAAVGGGGGGGGDQKAVEQVQEGEGSQDGGSVGEQKQKRRKQVKGAFGSGPRRTKEVDGAFGSGPRRTKEVDGAFGSGPRRTKEVDGAFGSGPRRTKQVD
eukprot:gene14475-21868_t